MKEHNCRDTFSRLNQGHNLAYGDAIYGRLYFYEDIGHWVVTNAEYATVVAFCPFCGVELSNE